MNRPLIAILLALLIAAPAQAAVGVASSTSSNGTGSGAGSVSFSTSVPSGLTTGDVWVISCTLDAVSGPSIATPSGFTAAHAQIDGNAGGYPSVRSFWKAAGASESAVTTSATGTGVYVMWCASIRVTGALTSGPIGNVATTNPTGSGNTLDAPDVTITNNDSAALLIMACSNTSDPTNLTITPPSGPTVLVEREGASTYPTASTAYELRATAGSYTPGNWTTTDTPEGRIGITMELLPTGGGGGGSVVPSILQQSAANDDHYDGEQLLAGILK